MIAGDNMKTRWKDILIALLLGLAFPGMLISMASRKVNGGDSIEQESTAITESSIICIEESCISVLTDTGVIESMELDCYLTGVVLCEMPVEFEMEALKAQAVVARTYTLRRMSTGGKHPGAAVCTNPSCCQGYRDVQAFLNSGGVQEQIEKVQDAVVSTHKQVLLYNGALIEATYFSCSGGRTEDALAVWGTEIPYLRATDSPGEENAAHYTDTVHFKSDAFLQLLGLQDSGRPESWIEEIRYTQGGGVDEIRICGQVFSGTKLRQLLNLRSTAFVITVVGDQITITTKGYGHRVGMSQYGAEAMAVSGSDYTAILNHYYTGTTLAEYSG